MKRTIQGVLVASLLIVGCGNSPAETVPADRGASNHLTESEIAEVRENLGGICNAIVQYGLVPDREIHQHIRTRLQPLARAVDVGSQTAPVIRKRARSTILDLATRYRHCDPGMVPEIQAGLG